MASVIAAEPVAKRQRTCLPAEAGTDNNGQPLTACCRRHWYAHMAEETSTRVRESRAAAKILAKVIVASQATGATGIELSVGFVNPYSEYQIIRFVTKYLQDDDFYMVVNVALILLAIVLFFAGQALTRLCKTGHGGNQFSRSMRSIACQSQVTYLRKRETPRFQPLPEYGHGAFDMVKE